MISKIPMIALGILTAGAMVAQKTPETPAAPAAPQQSVEGHHRAAVNWQDRMVQRMTRRLNLTPDQQVQVKAILKNARQENKAFAPQLREERMALHSAIRSDSLAQIDRVTQQNSNVNEKAAANHLKAVAKIYSILNPDQKAKFDQRFDRFDARQAKGV